MELKLSKSRTKQSQITEYMRERILTETFESGSRLPSARHLAKEWGIPEVTVHRALSALVKEGLIIRKPKMGTIINPSQNKLSTVAIYVKQDLRHPASDFIRMIVGFIEEELRLCDIDSRIVMESSEGSSLQYIAELAEKRQIQGLIVPMLDDAVYNTISKFPVPFSCMTTDKIKNRLLHYDKPLIDLTMDAFKRSGCRKIGMVSSLIKFTEKPKHYNELSMYNFYKYFEEKCKENGFDLRDEWIYAPESEDADGHGVPPSGYTLFAFNGFNKIWQNEEKPDGLFIQAEGFITGLILAVMAKKLNIPDELALVFHRKKEDLNPCPLPCFFVEDSAKEMAKDLVDLIKDQFYGRTVELKRPTYILKEHKV